MLSQNVEERNKCLIKELALFDEMMTKFSKLLQLFSSCIIENISFDVQLFT